MTHRPHNTPAPYAVRTKHFAGKTFTQIYVPSRVVGGVQGYAWIELVDPPTGDEELKLRADEVLDLLYDPTYLADWKVAYLQQAYRDFRSVKNARELGDLSYSDWEVEVHDGRQFMNVSVHEDQVDSELVVDWLLSQVSAKQAEQIRLHVFERLSFVEIARKEWGCVQVVDGLFMRLLSRPLGVVRIRWGFCRRGWCGCGGGCRSLRSRWRPRCRPGRGW